MNSQIIDSEERLKTEGSLHEITKKVLEAIDEHNLNSLKNYYDPDSYITVPGAKLHGIDQVINWYRIFIKAFPDIKHEVIRTLTFGDMAAVEVKATGTQTGPLASPAGEIPPSGKKIELYFVTLTNFVDGKIKKETCY
jgi:predicted ester cyclase